MSSSPSSSLLSALSSLPSLPLAPSAFYRDLRSAPLTHDDPLLLPSALLSLSLDFTISAPPWSVSRTGATLSGHFSYLSAGRAGRGYLVLRGGALDRLFTQTLYLLAAPPASAPVAFAPGAPAQVIIAGAGQAGLALSARLNRLGVRSTVVERGGRVGDNWRER